LLTDRFIHPEAGVQGQLDGPPKVGDTR